MRFGKGDNKIYRELLEERRGGPSTTTTTNHLYHLQSDKMAARESTTAFTDDQLEELCETFNTVGATTVSSRHAPGGVPSAIRIPKGRGQGVVSDISLKTGTKIRASVCVCVCVSECELAWGDETEERSRERQRGREIQWARLSHLNLFRQVC